MFLRVLFAIMCAGATVAQLPPSARIVMSHFRSDGGGGDERLYISWSADGLNWTAINNGNPVWQPTGWAPFANVVRDPAITFSSGAYWVCYTQGNYGRGSKFGLVRSEDLLNWTQIGPIDVPLPGATDPLTWSPSFFVDGDGSVHVFVSINPAGGSDYNPFPTMRIYETHPLDAEWTQWSAPVAVGLPETNTNEFFCWKEGAVFHAVYVDFGRNGAVVHATSTALLTGWVHDRVLGYASQEGPFVLPKPQGGYRLYLEPGNVPSNPPAHYRWCDLDGAFASPTAQQVVSATVPMRNGKPCVAHGALSFAAWQTGQLASVPVELREPLADADADGLENLIEHALGTDATAFTEPSRFPQPHLRVLPDGAHPGLSFDWFASSADVTVRAEAWLADGTWSSAPAEVVIESQTLLSDGTVRTLVHAAQPLGNRGIFRFVATLAPPPAPAAATTVAETFGVKMQRNGTKAAVFRKSLSR